MIGCAASICIVQVTRVGVTCVHNSHEALTVLLGSILTPPDNILILSLSVIVVLVIGPAAINVGVLIEPVGGIVSMMNDC